MTTQSDYWCNRSLVITVEGPGSRQRVEVDKPFARLGSHDRSEVLIPDRGVSRRRLYFHATDDGVYCVDLAQVKSATSRSRGWLDPDDCIQLGSYRIRAQLAPPAASEVRPPPQAMADLDDKGTAPEPQPVIVMSIKGKEIARRDLTRQLTILGRRSPSTLRITSHSVSAAHCVLYWKADILWVVDLFSGNGTRLQGRPIDVAQFSPGDSLKVGRAELHHVDMFEKLPDGDEVEPAKISYSPGHEQSAARDDLDDGQGSEIHIDDSSPEIAESLALAARLATQREELDAQIAAWNGRRQVADAELAEKTEHLAAERAELNDQKARWEETLQREKAEQTVRKSQLDETADALASERQQLDALRTQAEEQRRQAEDELAVRAGQRESIEELQAELDSQKARWEETLQREERQLASRKSQLEEMAAALENEKEELTTLREQAEEERRKAEAALADQARRRESVERLQAEIEDRRREFERETDLRSTEQDRREAEYQRHVEELLKRQEEFLTQQEDHESRQSQRREEAVQSERELAQGREDLERQRSELEAARDELRQQMEARQSKHEDEERSLDERRRQLQEASTLLEADRDEFHRLHEKREEEHRQANERLEELTQESADQRADLQSRRQAWETKRQQDEEALADRSEELDEASAALAGDRDRFEAQRNAWEEELRQERNESRPDQQSTETGPPEASAISNLDGSPRLAALTTIRRGPRWTPTNHTDEPRPILAAYWACAMLVAVACSGIAGAAVWFYLTPSYKITILAIAAVDQEVTTGPESDGDLGPQPPDSRSPEDIIKSNNVLSAALDSVDGPTFSEISRGGDPLTWLHDELMVSYSSETKEVRIGLRGSYVSKARRVLDEIAKAFMAEWKPASAIIDRQATEYSYRLSLTIIAAALGLFLPILLAAVWGRRWRAAGSGLPYGLA